jgi:hypothetical protein
MPDSETERSTNITRIHTEHGRQQAREPNTEIAHQSEVEEDDTEGEDESDTDGAEQETISKYFSQPRHAGMAKRKNADDTMLAPKRSRQATHDQRGIEQNDSSSDSSDENDDSWYYSDDGSVSQAYWDFVAKHGARKMKNYLPDDEKCDKCFRFGQKCDLTMKGMPCTMCAEGGRGVCRPQTKQTKKLVLPKNRSWKKQITGLEQDPPCRKCFTFSIPCLLADPADSQLCSPSLCSPSSCLYSVSWEVLPLIAVHITVVLCCHHLNWS